MIVVGLTGSIGMGKSTTARLFAEEGAALFDSDAAVTQLYAQGGAAVAPIAAIFPDVIIDGAVDREKLASHLRANPEDFAALEALVHPLVAQLRARFVAEQRAQGARVAVLDTPLLFETGLDEHVDVIVVASAPEAVQKARVLARPGMTEARFHSILARQTPDSKKRLRADYVIDTGRGLPAARKQVREVMERITGRLTGVGRAGRGGDTPGGVQ